MARTSASDSDRLALPHTAAVAGLSEQQHLRLVRYGQLLRDLNRKLNLVSRESDEEVEALHIPHSLSLLAKPFNAGASIVDWGTGGGLPAIPLAIALPENPVTAVDVIEKKILAVRTMARRIGVHNLEAWAGDAALWPGESVYSISRATAALATLWKWHARIAIPAPVQPGAWAPGLVCLKGGDLSAEIQELRDSVEAREGVAAAARLHVNVLPLRAYCDGEYFLSKVIVHVYYQDEG